MKTLLVAATAVGLLATAPAFANGDICAAFSNHYVYEIGTNSGENFIFVSDLAQFDKWTKVRTYLNNNAVDTSDNVHLYRRGLHNYYEFFGGIRREQFSWIGDFNCEIVEQPE